MVTLFRTLIFLLVNSAVYATPANDLESADRFSIRSSGIRDSGSIEIHGQQRSSGEIANMQIEAFGRQFEFPRQLLGELSVNHLQDLQLFYDPGEMSLNGKILYIRIHSYNSGIDRPDLSIAINENGQIHVWSE